MSDRSVILKAIEVLTAIGTLANIEAQVLNLALDSMNESTKPPLRVVKFPEQRSRGKKA